MRNSIFQRLAEIRWNVTLTISKQPWIDEPRFSVSGLYWSRRFSQTSPIKLMMLPSRIPYVKAMRATGKSYRAPSAINALSGQGFLWLDGFAPAKQELCILYPFIIVAGQSVARDCRDHLPSVLWESWNSYRAAPSFNVSDRTTIRTGVINDRLLSWL